MYAGELFRYFMVQAGIAVKGRIVREKADPGRQTLVLRALSEDRLTDIIADLLEFSNNFIANQLMLTMGAHVYGEPATVEKGLRALRHYYNDVLGITSGHIAEASGISRQNRVSARIMLQLLLQFQPHHQLMRRNGRHWYKTGHLKGIRTQAGYLMGGDQQLYPYVVLVNTPGKTTHRLIREIEKSIP
jgi:D-alanyl-D-alanine carboxypeptidase/D-alanyl-D-alanine-endopeptidase (penicillin-binding protein 4)